MRTVTRPWRRRALAALVAAVVVIGAVAAPSLVHALTRPGSDGAAARLAEWGSTIGQAAYIHRSAFGVTADGAEVYVGGPALSVCTLGELLRAAGAVRGMELDINPAWVSGAYFHPTGAARPEAFRLFPDEQVGAQHYLQASSRDFLSFDLRMPPSSSPPMSRSRPGRTRRSSA